MLSPSASQRTMIARRRRVGVSTQLKLGPTNVFNCIFVSSPSFRRLPVNGRCIPLPQRIWRSWARLRTIPTQTGTNHDGTEE